MSRLWRDQLQVFLAPDQVIIAGQSRGFKPLPLFRQRAGCPSLADLTVKPLPWEWPLNQLEQLIEPLNAQIKTGSELQITLADDFVRYGMIAPQPTLANPDEMMAYAGFQMREIYGERVEEWALSVSNWDPLNGGLCAGVSLGLLAALEHFAVRHEWKLSYTEPYLAAVLDYWSGKLSSEQLWFVLIESNRFCLVSTLAGRWRSIRNQRIVGNLEQELLSAMEQEAILADQPVDIAQPRRVQVFAPDTIDWQSPQAQGWYFERLTQSEQPVPAHFPFAISPENQASAYAQP